MNPFRLVYPRTSLRRTSAAHSRRGVNNFHAELPDHTFLLDELLYCSEADCDCRRVVLNVLDTDARRHVATLN